MIVKTALVIINTRRSRKYGCLRTGHLPVSRTRFPPKAKMAKAVFAFSFLGPSQLILFILRNLRFQMDLHWFLLQGQNQ